MMNDPMHDADLRALFDAQRRTDASGTPSFAGMMARARAGIGAGAPVQGTVGVQRPADMRWVGWRREWTGALAAAAALAALIIIPRLHTGEDAFEQAVRAFETDPALGGWQSPTDALLHLPGDGLLSTVPSVQLESQ